MSTLPLFDGRTYDAARDGKRLVSQLDAVCQVMKDGRWRTVAEIHHELTKWGIQATETSISSRIRDLRKAKFGAYEISARCIERGLWAFRMEVIS
jgi:hypothetical protein